MTISTTVSSTTVGIALDPLDVLFFRDGRPFTASERLLSGLPLPQTLAGAIRTALLQRIAVLRGQAFRAAALSIPQDERIDFSRLFDNDDHYCLRVKGDSMIEDQIADGDYVIIRRQSTCQNGEIVVALIERQEATLKRFYKEKKRIKLQPANSSMKPIYSSDVEILGVVVGVVRRLSDHS
jgi:SOS regulatory protein LexA